MHDGAAPTGSRQQQFQRALSRVGLVERDSKHLPSARRPRRIDVVGLYARQRSRHRHVAVNVPLDEANEGAGAAMRTAWSISARMSAGMVRLAKFPDDDVVQVRAFYPQRRGPSLTAKIVVGPHASRRGLDREISARTTMHSDGVPGPQPMLDHGRVDDATYLVEPLIAGRHAQGPEEKGHVAQAVYTDLLARYRSERITDSRPKLHSMTMARFQRLLEHPDAQNKIPAAELRDTMAVLLTRRTTLPTGWCHGDLVFSNIIVGADGRHHLVDWEYARPGPLAGDLTKLMCAVPDPWPLVTLLERSVTTQDIGAAPGRYGLTEQLMLMLLRELSWWESRYEAAQRAGRHRQFRSATRRRMRLLEGLVDPSLRPATPPTARASEARPAAGRPGR